MHNNTPLNCEKMTEIRWLDSSDEVCEGVKPCRIVLNNISNNTVSLNYFIMWSIQLYWTVHVQIHPREGGSWGKKIPLQEMDMASNTSLMASKVVLIPNGRDVMDSATSGDLFLLCKGDMYNLSVFSPEWWHQYWDGQIEASMGSWGKLWALAYFSDNVLSGSTKKRRGSKIVMQWFYN